MSLLKEEQIKAILTKSIYWEEVGNKEPCCKATHTEELRSMYMYLGPKLILQILAEYAKQHEKS